MVLLSPPQGRENATAKPRIPVGARARVRLLATTDLHMNLTSHDYFADRPDPTVGLTRTATLIHQARAEAERDGTLVMLFDNGDGLQGTPLSDLAAEQPEREHPLMRAFGHLNYDALGLGNHDFNFGLRILDSALRQAPCPVLSSNLRRLGHDRPAGFEPFAILDRMLQSDGEEWPIRIGVLSFLPPQTVKWDAHLLDGHLEADAIVSSARRWLPELRHAGCDLIVALAHTGFSASPDHPELENAALPLTALEGIDAVIAGHTHLRLPGPDHYGLEFVDAENGSVHGKPVVMAGTSGSDLGVIDLELRADGARCWRIERFSCALRPIARRTDSGQAKPIVAEDADLVRLLSEDHAQTRSLMEQPVGHTRNPLHSYFTFFAPDRALALVATAQAAALRPHLAGTAAEGLPLLSATAPSKFGARAGPGHYTDVPAGRMSLRHIADLHVFPNQISCVVVTGAQLLDWLEMSATLFQQITPGGTDQMLLDPALPGHDFDVIHGVRYRIDLSAPPRFHPDGTLRAVDSHRIRNLTHGGQRIRGTDRFAVALNSFRAGGGGPFSALGDAIQVPVPPIPIRDVIRAQVSGQLPAERLRRAPAPWKFAPMRGTTVMVLTGPGAQEHLDELRDRGVRVDGVTPDGFLRLYLPL
ncbi:bifunctional 2',3'-cyclic-nucleotide 2'-phosphodiesterase/3'-nucleotidase [Rhodobacteraceae bacterium F11138]|nr:bifunctional 2',3'-cyclic-nucleotide 2'-phosphodiesterase/3'-nucleotidase [Rhodobacteraceae bacterium F11138]